MGAAQIASGAESSGVAGALLRAGASPNCRSNEGATALVHAIEKGAPIELIEALCRGGACPEVAKLDGSAPHAATPLPTREMLHVNGSMHPCAHGRRRNQPLH